MSSIEIGHASAIRSGAAARPMSGTNKYRPAATTMVGVAAAVRAR